jgi:hypothetical protein
MKKGDTLQFLVTLEVVADVKDDRSQLDDEAPAGAQPPTAAPTEKPAENKPVAPQMRGDGIIP